MRYARIQKSPRLQRVWSYLKAQGKRGASTREIIEATGQCAINSCIAELRAQGRAITCKFQGRTLDGASVYRYTLGSRS